MGKPDDPRAVLDSHARVRGVSGLRVVDASSAPLLGPGHPIATVCKSPSYYFTRNEIWKADLRQI